jgi:hypothetical protein
VCSPDIGATLPLPSPQAILKRPLLSDSTSYRSPERFGWPEWFRHVGLQPAEALREQRFGNGLLACVGAAHRAGVSGMAVRGSPVRDIPESEKTELEHGVRYPETGRLRVLPPGEGTG